MELLWRAGPRCVREVTGELDDGGHPLAYTTVMTTLDRLFKKGLLSREKDGQAFVYAPALTRDDYHRRIVEETVSGLMAKPADADPVLAAFVDAAATVDEANLERLERLIAERRRTRK
jgi:predicted transcriptional regulator